MIKRLSSVTKKITKVTSWEARCEGCNETKVLKTFPKTVGEGNNRVYLCRKCIDDLRLLSRQIMVNKFLGAKVIDISPSILDETDEVESILLEIVGGERYLFTGGNTYDGGDIVFSKIE